MMHVADRGLPDLKHVTPDICRETSIAPAVFNLNLNNAVCLPVVSEGQKLIWVKSSQIDLQLDGAAELDKAFDRFPYLTERQTAALAQRCSLHPDQVKVWFMSQRLRYGISWDYKDILDVWRKVRPNLQNRMEEEADESAGKKQGKASGQSRNEKRIMADNVRANEQLERKIEQEQPVNKMKDRKFDKEDKRNSQQKQKRTSPKDKMGAKKMKPFDEAAGRRAGEVDITRDQKRRQRRSTQFVTTVRVRKKEKEKANKRLLSIQRRPADKSFLVSGEPLDGSPVLFPQPQTKALTVLPPSGNLTEWLRGLNTFPTTSNCQMITMNTDFEVTPGREAGLEEKLRAGVTNHSVVISDVDKLTNQGNSPDVAGSSSTFTQKQKSQVKRPCTLPPPLRSKAKTWSQLEMMKVAFCHCQYPDRDDYDQLAFAIGVPRYVLIRWFGDMRYYIKKAKPRWMTQEQHSQALSNIRYRQGVKALAKGQPIKGIRNTT